MTSQGRPRRFESLSGSNGTGRSCGYKR